MSLLTLSRTDARLRDLPTSWSNRDRHEQLQNEAAESFSNLVAIAVADTGTNFQLYDALRPIEEQEAIFRDRYRRTSWGSKRNSSDRYYQGAVWRKVKGANAAAPGFSNHGSGLAVDLHPGPIQEVFKAKGPAWGWSWDEGRENGEDWHFVFEPGRNQFADRGWLDHAAVQRAVGADVDGKIGTGTVKLIKAWQTEHGVTADGIVGPATKAAMGLAAAPVTPPAAVADEALTSSAGGFTYTFARTDWDTQPVDPGVHPYDAPVEGIYLHWPGSRTDFAALDADGIAQVLRGYRRNHQDGNGWRDFGYGAAVDLAGNTYQGRGLDMEVGSNGGSVSNSGAGSILLMVPIGGKPSAAMIEAVNGLLAQYGDKYGRGFIAGHQESPEASTSCPGDVIQGLIDGGTFHWDGDAGSVQAGGKLTPALGQLIVDGRCGTDTIKALQRFLNNRVNAGLKVDGRAGPKTWKAYQQYLDAPYTDGEISRQSYEAEELGNGIVPGDGWEFTGRGSDGSQTVVLSQRWCGVDDDGVWFEEHSAGLQRKLNVHKVGM